MLNSDFTLAVHSLVLLALRSNQLSSGQIAQSACVHPARLRKILSLLRKNGYIESKSGAGGGFVITCHPSEVSLDEIYRLTSLGTLKPKCPDCNPDCIVGANIEGVLDRIFLDAEQQVEKFLSQFTINDLMKRVKQEQG
jgi:Rrf2 family protein